MPRQEPNYFGVQLGDAIAAGAGHISEALQRKYAMQRRDEEMARQREEEKAKENRTLRMSFAEAGIEYDPNNPEAAFAEFSKVGKTNRAQDEQVRAAQIGALNARAVPDTVGDNADYGDDEVVKQLGLPTRKNPYKNMSEKMLLKVKPTAMAAGEKVVKEANDKRAEAEGATAELNRVKSLLEEGMKTGPLVGRIKKIGQYLPGDTLSEQVGTFEQVANKLIPTMRQGMPGAASDRDVAMFAKATIGIDKKEKVNMNIINQALAVGKRIADKADFLSSYVEAYGDAKGAESAWSKYINSNPLFNDNGEPLEYISYKDYFNNIRGREVLTERQKRIQQIKKELGRQ